MVSNKGANSTHILKYTRMKIEQQQLRETLGSLNFLSLDLRKKSLGEGVFLSIGGTFSSSPAVLVESNIETPVLYVMHTSQPYTWIPIKSALEQVSSKLAALESALEAESNEALEKAVSAACERNEVEQRVKRRKEVEDTQKAFDSILPLNGGAAEVTVDNDGFYYIREEEEEEETPQKSTIINASSSYSRTDSINWDGVMEKLNKFEELEKRKVDEPHERKGALEGQKERIAAEPHVIEKKGALEGQQERIAAEPHVIEKLEQKSTHSPSTIPFSGKVFERTTTTINTYNPSSRQRSLFSQYNRE